MIEFILNNFGIFCSIVTGIVIFYATQRVMKHFTYCERQIEKIGQFVSKQSSNSESTFKFEISEEETEIINKLRNLDEKRRERLLERLETLSEEQENLSSNL